jgi:hypothetical protein
MAKSVRLPFTERSDSANEQDTIQYLEEQYEAADQQRRLYEPDWATNIQFLAGNQWEEFQADYRRFGRKIYNPPQSKIKLTCNVIFPLARQAASSMRQNLAEQIAIAATSDPRDEQAAALASDLIQYRVDEDREEDIRFHEILLAMCCGRVLRKTFWDPDRDSEGIAGKLVGAGDISTMTLHPWRFHVCPYSDNASEPLWIIESDVRDIDEINDLWPGHDVQEEEYADATRYVDHLLTNVVYGTTGTPKRKNAAILKRLYAKPSKKYPKGKVWTWAAGKLLAESDLPEGEMPFVPLDWFPIPMRVYPLPFVSPLRDMQKEINVTMSQLVELKNRQLRGDIVVTGAGGVRQTFAKDEEGNDTAQKVIEITNPGASFNFLQYNMNTTEAEILINRLRAMMDDDAGVHEPTMGKEMPRATTATQVRMLREADHSGLSMFREGFDQAYCKVSRHKLIVAKNHYDIPRMIRVVGEGNVKNTTAFFGSELRRTEDVRPRPKPALDESIKQQMIADAYAAGMFDFSGPANAKLSKVKGLVNLGIPGIEDEIEKRLGMTIEELEDACAEINRTETSTSLLMAKAGEAEVMMRMQAMAQAQQAAQEPQQAPEPRNPAELLTMVSGGATTA